METVLLAIQEQDTTAHPGGVENGHSIRQINPEHPRCPEKIVEDLSVLAECCFVGASRRNALEKALTAFLQTIPNADAEDLIELISGEDLIHRWTCLTWYALCGDLYG